MHDADPHAVVTGASLHAPAPLHVPVSPQGGLATQRSCGSAASSGTKLQTPALPELLQAWQVPQLEVPQHTPSTQKLPVRHSVVDPHAWPSAFLSPHRFVLGSQMLGAMQLVLETQVVSQLEPLQAKGAHGSVLAGRQVPAPSQVRASVAVEVPMGHVGGAHSVPAEYSWHAPAPSQTPV